MKVLVINAGSSSLKYQLIDTNNNYVLAKGLCERIGIDGQLTHTTTGKHKVIYQDPLKDHSDAINGVIKALLDPVSGAISSMEEIEAVGHRVVHGGELFADSVLITDEVMAAIESCVPLAPLHNPANIIGINACKEAMPNVPQVGVFDTAFHQSMPSKAYMYALPYELYEKHKIRRYGFHGTSHKYVSQRCAAILGKDISDLKIITCHLGNGSSITAVDGGKSVDTTMGFTPLAGVPMGTRSGDIDPAIVTFIMENENMTAKEVDALLNKQSGVLGVGGITSDFRDIREAADNGNKRARLALDLFVYQVKKCIGQYAVAMGGVDAIVFTAGIGENDIIMKKDILEDLGFLGVKVDKEKITKRGEEVDFSADGAKVRTLVIPTNEELMIALDTKKIVG